MAGAAPGPCWGSASIKDLGSPGGSPPCAARGGSKKPRDEEEEEEEGQEEAGEGEEEVRQGHAAALQLAGLPQPGRDTRWSLLPSPGSGERGCSAPLPTRGTAPAATTAQPGCRAPWAPRGLTTPPQKSRAGAPDRGEPPPPQTHGGVRMRPGSAAAAAAEGRGSLRAAQIRFGSFSTSPAPRSVCCRCCSENISPSCKLGPRRNRAAGAPRDPAGG